MPRWMPLIAQRLYAAQELVMRRAVERGTSEPWTAERELADYASASMWWINRDMALLCSDTAADWIANGGEHPDPPSAQGLIIWEGGIRLSVTPPTMTKLGPIPIIGLYWDIVPDDVPHVDPGLHYWLLTGDARLLDGPFRSPVATVSKWGLGREVEEYVTAMLEATWALSRVPTVASERDGSWSDGDGVRPRALDKAMKASQSPVRYVYVRENLRNPNEQDKGDGKRSYDHRWIVRGFYRMQAYGPRWSKRRRVWVPPFIKGAAEKPLKVKPIVHIGG